MEFCFLNEPDDGTVCLMNFLSNYLLPVRFKDTGSADGE